MDSVFSNSQELTVKAFILVSLKVQQEVVLERFENRLAGRKKVKSVTRLNGEVDFIVEYQDENLSGFNKFRQGVISSCPDVERPCTHVGAC